MRTASRFLAALFGMTLIVFAAGGAGAQPTPTDSPAGSTPPATSEPEDPPVTSEPTSTTTGTPLRNNPYTYPVPRNPEARVPIQSVPAGSTFRG